MNKNNKPNYLAECNDYLIDVENKLCRQKRINRYLVLTLILSTIIASSDVEFIKKAWAAGEAFMNSTQSGWFYTKNQNTSGTTWAIQGESTNGSGIYGISWAGRKAGLYGYNGSTTANGVGVQGVSMGPLDSPFGPDISGISAGVYGECNSNEYYSGNEITGAGVYGKSTWGSGVYGESNIKAVQGISENDIGVYGKSKKTFGVWGSSACSSFIGLCGAAVGESDTTFGGVFEGKPSRGQLLLRQNYGQDASNRSSTCTPGELRSEKNGAVSRLYYCEYCESCESKSNWKIVILGDP